MGLITIKRFLWDISRRKGLLGGVKTGSDSSNKRVAYLGTSFFPTDSSEMAYFSSSPPSLANLSLGYSDSTSSDEPFEDYFGLGRLLDDTVTASPTKGKERLRIDSGVGLELDDYNNAPCTTASTDHVDAWSEEGDLTDPARVFPVEVFLYILSFLPSPGELYPCFLVSKAWNAAASDKALWSAMTERLWEDKVFVPEKWVVGGKTSNVRLLVQ